MTRILLSSCRLMATLDDAGSESMGTSIVMEDGWITYIGPDPPVAEYDEVRDCRHFVALPGFVNTHHHLYQTLTRGFPESEGKTLFSWLQSLYRIWAGLDSEMVHASTRAGLAELALSGCTTCADHLYLFPAGSEDFIDSQVEAARSIGLRFHPTRGSMDLGESDGGLPPDSVVQTVDTILLESERAIVRYNDPRPGSMIRVGVAPCSPFSASADLMRLSAELARRHRVRLHTHIAETRDEDVFSEQRYGMSPLQLLDSLGWLADDVWLAHAVHPREEDIAPLAASGAGVAHCPTSNLLLSSGLAPVEQYRRAGVPVGLGVDGSASNDGNDLRNEIKQALLCGRLRDGPLALSARDALRLATRGGAACLGRDDIGSLEAGKVADIVLFDAESLEMAGGSGDLLATVVLGAAKPHTVIVNGRTVVIAGRLLTGDTNEIAARQNRESARLLAKANG